MLKRVSVFLSLLAFASFSQAGSLDVPKQIEFMGKSYQLAFQNTDPNGSAIYEYTAKNESVEKWTSLVTINYANVKNITKERWVQVIKDLLVKGVPAPAPYSDVYSKGKYGFAKVVYFGNMNGQPMFESNVQKSFFNVCDGWATLQYAQRYEVKPNQSEAENKQLMASIMQQNTAFTSELEENRWTPTCKP